MAETPTPATSERPPGKSAGAFRTISEVARELDLPQHVLRFWETKFNQVRPLKRGGGRRYYRPEDIQLLRRIRDLLYSEGYTIKGVQKLLRAGSAGDAEPKPLEAEADPPPASAERSAELKSVLGELEEIRALLQPTRS